MIRVTSIKAAGTWQSAPADSVVLDREDRYRRRAVLTTTSGLSFLLDEPSAVFLHQGDGLELEDGRTVEVVAEAENLVEITATSTEHLIKIAWHLGNRHLPTQLGENRLIIRRDHVIEDMVSKLGGTLTPLTAPFEPEGGAYGHGQTHGHDHGHSRDLGAGQSHSHDH